MFVPFISDLVPLFDMEMFEVMVRLLLGAFGLLLSISLERGRKWKRREIGDKI